MGSTIKPLLYSLAMENGFSPCDEAPNVQQTYMVAGKPWTPRNSGRARYGQMATGEVWLGAWTFIFNSEGHLVDCYYGPEGEY